MAVGQLYEYRFFQVADPRAALLFLSDKPVPQNWVDYLERDRQIGAAWPSGNDFVLTDLAHTAIGL
jgi:hypothetical protein